ncbi:hypothetical protein C8J56DRAFT_63419 [Mycena floridula]|nr:hypothetical protein C8J56DRAFT_63419 [Mycena floridula]
MSHSMSPQKRRFHHISGSPASSSQRKRQHLVDIPTFSTPEPTFSDFTTTALSLSPSRAHSPMLLELYSSNSETYAPTENDQFELPASSASSPEFSDQFLDQFLDQFPDLFPDLSTTCQSEPSFDAFSAENEVLDNPLVLPWTEAEMEEKLSAETHSARLSIQDEIAAGKDTLALYKRQVDNYVTFMAWDQEVRVEADPRWVVQSWEPINAAKVAVYLKYVMTRAKHTPKGADIPGTRVGAGVIKQVINALEHWRFNHQHEPLYKANQSSQIPLRDDSHIKTIEKSMAALKPQRIAEAHSRKAEGSSAGSFGLF